MPSRKQIEQLSTKTGFLPLWLEKGLRLKEILHAYRLDRNLGDKLALKGGTALNLGLLGLERLSVDLDYNYVGSSDRDLMMADRPVIEAQIVRVSDDLGYGTRKLADSYAITKWSLGYETVLGGPDALRVEVNFLDRLPLFDVQQVPTIQIGDELPTTMLCLSPEELIAGKAKALIERGAARDLFDLYRFQKKRMNEFDFQKLRLAFIVRAATLSVDVRGLSAEQITSVVTEQDIRENLVPMIRRSQEIDRESLASSAGEVLVNLLDLRNGENAFLEAVYAGQINPNHLTLDEEIRGRILKHPPLKWKVQNVLAHLRGARPPEGRRRGRPRLRES